MNIDWVREFCLSLPHTTETMQWKDDLVFKIGGKMYAVVALEPGDHWISFKCSDEDFGSLIERSGVVSAPYLARAKWVALETDSAVSRDEMKEQLRRAYSLIFAKLSKKQQSSLRRSTPTRATLRKASPRRTAP
jgi:predicted DNA-binding protein (MmcQ/YjbR family)